MTPRTAIAIATALTMSGAPLPAADAVAMKNGRKVECEVTGFTDTAVRVRYRAGSEWKEREVPLAEVEGVDFGPLPGEAEAKAEAVRTGSPDPLIPHWVKRLPWIGRPRCPAGETGLMYAELLARRPSDARIAQALEIYAKIESDDWSDERRARARAGRLRLMLRQGRTDEVLPQAETLLRETGDPRVVIELHHVLAEYSEGALTKLERDHPRWEQEDDIVPERTRLLNAALDGYLFPHLFYGGEEDLAARGLWAAAVVCRSHDDPDQAAAWAADLTHLYPGTPEAAAAAEWLATLPGSPEPPATPEPPDTPSEEETE